MYEIKSAGVKGLGVFAKTLIPRGTRIFSEAPLIAIRPGQNARDIYSSWRSGGEEERRKFLGLSSHVTKELSVLRYGQAAWWTLSHTFASIFGRGGKVQWPNVQQHVKILSIFRNNAFSLSPSSQYQQAVFPKISRMNHSCVPNAQGNFHDGLGRFNVHATRDIRAGEEVMLSYLQEHGAGREARMERLSNGYGFACDCPACDLTSSRAKDGEKRRTKMQDDLAKYVEGGVQSLDAELDVVMRFIMLLEGEGIAGRELSTLYLEAAKLNEGHEKLDDAMRCAERALEIDGDCLGIDHPFYQDSMEVVQRLEELVPRSTSIEDEKKLAMQNY